MRRKRRARRVAGVSRHMAAHVATWPRACTCTRAHEHPRSRTQKRRSSARAQRLFANNVQTSFWNRSQRAPRCRPAGRADARIVRARARSRSAAARQETAQRSGCCAAARAGASRGCYSDCACEAMPPKKQGEKKSDASPTCVANAAQWPRRRHASCQARPPCVFLKLQSDGSSSGQLAVTAGGADAGTKRRPSCKRWRPSSGT